MPNVPQDERISSELVNLKEVYERRYVRRKEAFDIRSKEILKALDPLIASHQRAVRAYEDHFDDGLLRYSRDPNQMPFDDRDPHEVKKARALKRGIEDAEACVRKRETELTDDLRKTSEFVAFRSAQIEFEDWLAKVCTHLKCCTADLDWKERQVRRTESVEADIPSDLLAAPKE